MASARDQSVLAAWSGWGALPEVFERPARPEWEALASSVSELLPPDRWRAARASTPNAHYTSTTVASAMWATVQRLGFVDGRVLEPGCGSGNFFGLAPADLALELHGVEADPTTAEIAKALYPQARIHAQPFERVTFEESSFDLVIGNVPFANVTPFDPVYNRDGWSLHNYFIGKSVRLLRPGGLLAVVTSRYTLDAADPSFRTWLAGEADLLGAVRLPGSAFRDVAGTTAVTDVILLRRWHDETPDVRASRAERWLQASTVALESSSARGVRINRWFIGDGHRWVCGRMDQGRGHCSDADLVVAPPQDIGERLRAQLAAIETGAAPRPTAAVPVTAAATPAAIADLPEGSIVDHHDGTFGRVHNGATTPHPVPASQRRELRALLEIRDAVTDLLEAEGRDEPTDQLDRRRAELNRRYDSYVERYGPLNRVTITYSNKTDPATGEPARTRRVPGMGGIRLDPGWALMSSLERFDEETGTAAKSNICFERVLRPREVAARATSPADAIALSLDQVGRVDVDLVARSLGVAPEDASRLIGDLVFEDPVSGELVPADEYLSGNVRDKLQAARDALVEGSADRFRRNIDALREVLPADLGPAEIDVAFGAPWIAPGDVAGFVREVLGASSAEVTHDPIVTAWTIGVPSWQKGTIDMTSTWGTSRRSGVDLVEAALNLRPVTVFDSLADGTRVVNDVETMAARDKLDQLAERFRSWIWEDPERADRLCQEYNRRFNSIVLRRYDGSHLQLPGLVDWFRPHRHQRDAVWRILSEGDVLLAHVVGAGKTATMVMAGMEMRRLGLVNKPAFVVPNHMLEQFTREFLQLYPAAKVLAANLGGTSPDVRRRFVAQCATGDWDAVIIPRDSFKAIPVSAETEAGFLRSRVDALEAALDRARDSRPSVKELEKALARERARLEKLLTGAGTDDGVSFELTGIDYLFVDEAHAYKGKRIASRIPDVAGGESQRATDLEMKLGWLRGRTPGRVATFATGTPIANAISEMWVMQSFLQPGVLEAAGCEHFDAWAATFASTVTSLELKPSGGGYQQKTRFARYRNVPELLRLFRANADVRTGADLDLPVPRVLGGDGETVAVPATPELVAYVETLVARAETVRQRAVRPSDDNMLKITGDGRKAALDLRLVERGVAGSLAALAQFEAGGPLVEGGKVSACARRVAALWERTRDLQYTDETGAVSPTPGALQIVFCDLGTPKADGGWSVYGELRDQLVAFGVPRDRVRFVHEAGNDRQKADLFRACRDGHVSVLIGSSEKMGVGTNIQARAVALHHVDCPWRPAELEQREGRILRQGNQNAEVHIVRYVTEGSFDVFMWQTVTRKARFINQVLSADPAAAAREIDDQGDQALTYAQVMAIATGNPLIMDKAAVEADLARLTRLRNAHDAEQRLLRRRVTGFEADLAIVGQTLARLRAAEERRVDTGGDRFIVHRPDGTTITSRAGWGEQLRNLVIDHATPHNHTGRRIEAGTLGGLDIVVEVPDQRLCPGASIVITATGQAVALSRADALDADPVGLTRRIEHLLDRIPTAITDASARLEDLEASLHTARARIGTPFPYQDELEKNARRLTLINVALAADAIEPDATEASLTGGRPRGLRAVGSGPVLGI